MDMCELFERFNLQSLPQDWIETILKNNFSKEEKLPKSYRMWMFEQNISIEDLLMDSRLSVFQWLNESQVVGHPVPSHSKNSCSLVGDISIPRSKTENRKTWQTLVQNGFNHKAFLCFLNTLIQEGKNKLKNEASEQLCLKAMGLYFLLLAIPGSKVFHVFNSTVYSNIIECLKEVCIASVGSSKNFKNCLKSNDRFKQKYGNNYLSLNDLFHDFIFFINRFKLNDQENSLILTIEVLIFITRLETKQSKLLPIENGKSSVPSLCYIALKDLCKPAHGIVSDVVLLIMDRLINSIVIVDSHSTNIKEAIVIKNHSIIFVGYLMHFVEDPAHLGVMKLVQNMCIKSPDRADERNKNTQSVFEIMAYLPDKLYQNFEIWIMKLCHNENIKNRLTGLELVAKLLSAYPNNRQHVTSLKFLLGAIFSRFNDVSFTVQTKALSLLSRILSSNNAHVQEEMKQMFVNFNGENQNHSKKRSKKGFNFQYFIKKIHENLDTTINPLPNARSVIKHLEVMLASSKASVSKSSLQVLTSIFMLNEKLITNNLLESMKRNCLDPSVSVRIQSIQSMTELLLCYPSHKEVPTYWIQTVMPLLNDIESRSQEKALQALQSTLLNNIVAYEHTKLPLQFLPWTLLRLLTELNMNSLLRVACFMWTKNKTLRENLFKQVYTHVETEHNDIAWCFLAYLSQYKTIRDERIIQKIILYFYMHVHSTETSHKLGNDWVTEVLFLNLESLPRNDQVGLMRSLNNSLNNFEVPLTLIQGYMGMCQSMITNFAAKDRERHDVKEWAKSLIVNAEEKLAQLVDHGAPLDTEIQVAQVVFVLAEALHILPATVADRTVDTIVNLLSQGGPNWKGTVQAVSVVFLGRLALQDERKAKEYVELFGNLLQRTKYQSVKTNTMIALVDLCTRFTSMVEGHIPVMCLILRDPDVMLRRKTFKLLTDLIREDFLKVKCPLFFHLLIMLSDKDRDIHEKVKQFFIHSVITKYPNIMFQHFIESLFYYNSCYNHPLLQRDAQQIEESPLHTTLFSLRGPQRQSERRLIYIFMLENMKDDQKFHLNSKLCTDVLDNVIKGTICLNENGNELVRDVFYVLSCDQMRPRPQASNANADEGETVELEGDQHDERVVTKQLKSLNKFVVSEVLKKNTIEVIVPILVHLNTKLEQIKSILSSELRNCLRMLMKNYKNEVNSVLAHYPDLASEISFDLQHCSDNEEESDSDSSDESAPKSVTNLNMKQAAILIRRLTQAAIDVACKRNVSTASTSEETMAVQPNKAVEDNLSDSASWATSIMSIVSTHQQATTDLSNSSLFNHANTMLTTNLSSGEGNVPPVSNTSCTSVSSTFQQADNNISSDKVLDEHPSVPDIASTSNVGPLDLLNQSSNSRCSSVSNRALTELDLPGPSTSRGFPGPSRVRHFPSFKSNRRNDGSANTSSLHVEDSSLPGPSTSYSPYSRRSAKSTSHEASRTEQLKLDSGLSGPVSSSLPGSSKIKSPIIHTSKRKRNSVDDHRNLPGPSTSQSAMGRKSTNDQKPFKSGSQQLQTGQVELGPSTASLPRSPQNNSPPTNYDSKTDGKKYHKKKSKKRSWKK